jgi:hypothetical protein
MRRFIAGALALVIAQACTYSSVTAPHSSPVPIGETVSYTIYTTCGLDAMAFDIDGSLWVPTTIEPRIERERPPASRILTTLGLSGSSRINLRSM